MLAPSTTVSFTATKQGWKESLAAEKGLFARRRIAIAAPLDDFFFTPDYRNLIGTNREGDKGVVVNLDVGREIAELSLPACRIWVLALRGCRRAAA